jgi:outer membrane protein assembly factor BamB
MPAPRNVLAFLFCAACVAFSGGRPARAADWPTFRGDPRRTGNADGGAIPLRLERKWAYRPEKRSAADSSPAIAGGLVLIGLSERSVFRSGGRVVCLDAASGGLKWERPTSFPVFSSAAVAGGRVYVGEGYHEDSGCKLRCLEVASGEELWAFETRSHIESSPVVEGGRVAFGAGDDGLYCLDAASGKEVWHFPAEHIDLSPLAASGLVFAGIGYGEHAAVCLAAKDGAVRWRTPIDLPAWGAPVLAGARLFVGTGNGTMVASAEEPRGKVLCLAATTGKVIWSRDLPDGVHTAIALAGARLLAGCRDGYLYALDSVKGEVLWKCAAGSPVVASPLVGEKEVAAVGTGGKLVVASLETGVPLARVDLSPWLGEGAEVRSSPAAAGGRIFIGSSTGDVVCLGAP